MSCTSPQRTWHSKPVWLPVAIREMCPIPLNPCSHPSCLTVHHGGVRGPPGPAGVQPPLTPCQEHHAHGAAERQLRAAQPDRVPAQEESPAADHLLSAFGHRQQRRPPPRAHPEPVRQRQGEGQGTQPKKHEHRHRVLGPERSIPAGVWPLGAEVARPEPATCRLQPPEEKTKGKRDEAGVKGWKGKYGATLITSWYSGKRWDVSHAERAGLAAGASGLCGMSPRNSWKLGGESLQVEIALSPASFSYPGLVTVNTCLLALLAIAPICVTESCPQSHRNRG